ncbi:hypothetical protein ABT189_35705 [Streptomyces sp900105755]|uniref:hypothetical protein n=1 Tax=Streptomyces sp. 900105755 TaxID=3154389 RepID=UPI00332C0B94
MRNLLGPLLCRASASALVLASVRAPGTALTTAEPAPEAPRIPFAERHHALPRGADALQASADVTEPVRASGSGLRTVGLRDGFDSLGTPAGVGLNGLHAPRGAGGRTGLVAYNGGRGGTGDSLTHTTAGPAPVPLQDSADPADDVLDSTINEPGPVRARREPAYANTLGYDSDVFDPGTGLAHGGDQLTFRLVSQRDAAWAGALFAAVDAR